MDNSNDVADKVFIVTGGTQGLGEAVARRLAVGGAAGIVITGRNMTRGKEVAASISEMGTKTVFAAADFADVDECRKVTALNNDVFGRLDGLVNAAGFTHRANILETTPDFFDAMMAINVRAPFFLMQDAIRQMRACGSEGTIVNILSMAIHGGSPQLVAYAAAKTALASITRNTAYAMLPDRIRVNGLAIGWMNTPGEDAVQRQFHDRNDGWIEDAARNLPFGRLLEPAEVAETVAFLSSAKSGMMTGAIIDLEQRVPGCQTVMPPPPPRLQDIVD